MSRYLENHVSGHDAELSAYNSSEEAAPIPRLRSPHDYRPWAKHMQALLESQNLWHIIENRSYLTFDTKAERRRAVLDLILQSIDNQELLREIHQPRAAWLTLEAVYDCRTCKRLTYQAGEKICKSIKLYRQSSDLGCIFCELILQGVREFVPGSASAPSNSRRIEISNVRVLHHAGAEKLDHERFQVFMVVRLLDMPSIEADTFELRSNLANGDSILREPVPPTSQYFLNSSTSIYHHVSPWLQDCTTSHDLCYKPDPNFVPRRLLDIGRDGSTLRLREVDAATLGCSRLYAALSYCWGPQKATWSTNRGNLEEYYRQILLDSMPQTVYDAIVVCRKLGIPFLWIDALCIIQDDIGEHDWYEQCGEMLQIYSNAHIVIAADVSPSASSGFLYGPEDSVLRWRSFEVHHNRSKAAMLASIREHYGTAKAPSEHDPWNAITTSPLSKRGWALQESILPVRMLHFTANGMIWECNHQCRKEFGSMPYNMAALTSRALRVAKLTRKYRHLADLVNSHAVLTKDPDNEGIGRHIEDLMRENTSKTLYHAWQDIVCQFSQRQLTREDDKLGALSGLANFVCQSLGLSNHAYLAGLWEDDLLNGFLWYVVGSACCKKPTNYRAPTWSWASIDGSVQYFREHYQFSFEPEVIIHHTSCLASPFDPTGRVSAGLMVLTGALQEVTMHPKSTFASEAHRDLSESHMTQFPWVCGTDSQRARYQVICDEGISSIAPLETESEPAKYYCLLIGRHYDPRTTGSRVWWLVLQSGWQSDTYKRIGIRYFHPKYRGFSLFDYAEEKRITLL